MKTERNTLEFLKTAHDYSPLNEAMLGPIRGEVILAAIKLGIFDFLTQSAGAHKLADILGADSRKTGCLLDALTAEKLLVKKDGIYQNSELARDFLVSGSPYYLGEMYVSLAKLRYVTSEQIIDLLKKPDKKDTNRIDLAVENVWVKAASYLRNYQRAGIAGQVVEIVKGLPEFPTFTTVLDLGGGPGMIGIGIVLAHDRMRGVIFDLPGVVEAAKGSVSQYGLGERVRVIGGDYNVDFPQERFDLVFASLSLYYARDLDRLFDKIYDSLSPGGVFMSYHEGLYNERTGPAEHVIARIAVALRGQDLSFNRGEICSSMLRAGFCSVHSRTIDTANGKIDIDIARKRND